MPTKLEQLKTFLRNFASDVVQPANRQSGGSTWKDVQTEIRNFHNMVQSGVNTLDKSKIGQAGTVKDGSSNIGALCTYINKSLGTHASKAAKYELEHGQGGAKQRSVLGVEDEKKRVTL